MKRESEGIRLYMKFAIVAFIMSGFALNVVAQQFNIKITIQVVPPYSPKIQDYLSQPDRVIATLTNLTSLPKSVYLLGSVTGNNGISVKTDPGFKPPKPLVLQPGVPFRLNRNDLQDVFNADHLIFKGITRNDILTGNGLPEGEYTLCLKAFDYTTSQPVSAEEPLGCSAGFTISDLEVPTVISPRCGDSLDVSASQNIHFTWSRPPGCPPGTQYSLKIIELLPGERNINNAMMSGNHPLFFQKTVASSSYIYGSSDPKFVAGKRYAFIIRAIDPSAKVTFRNQGMSEVCWFKCRSGVTIVPGGHNEIVNPVVPMVSFRTISGKLTWAFIKTEEPSAPELLPGSSYFVNVNTQFGLAGSGSGTDTAAYQSNAYMNAQSSGGVSVYGGGVVQNASKSGGTGSLPSNTKDFQKQNQKKINDMAGSAHHPLSNTRVELHLLLNPDFQVNPNYIPGQPGSGGLNLNLPEDIFLGSVLTDKDGNFSMSTPEDHMVGYDLWVDVKDPAFEFAGYRIKFTAQGSKLAELGEMLGLANTYRFRPEITDDQGNKLEKADIWMLRPKGFYQEDGHTENLKHEIDREKYDDSSRGGNSLPGFGQNSFGADTVAHGISGTLFRRAFFSRGYSDRYLIAVRLGNGPVSYFNLLTQGSGSALEDGVLTVQKKYVIALPNPIVRGRILSSQGNLPLEGAKVKVAPADSKGMTPGMRTLFTYFGTTDKEGNFIVENIAVRSEPYALSVTYGQATSEDPVPLYLTRRGLVETRDPERIDAQFTTVCGKVQDPAGNPLPSVALHWKEGGNLFFSNPAGKFLTAQSAGKHVLVAQLPGFRDTEAEIDVSPETGGTGVQGGTGAGNYQLWTHTLNTQVFPGGSGEGGSAFFNSQLGFASGQGSFENGVSVQQYGFEQQFGSGLNYSSAVSCDHTITMKQFAVKVTVSDASSHQPVQGAILRIESAGNPVVTDAKGTAVMKEVPTGMNSLITSGPEASFYVTSKTCFSPDENKDTTLVSVTLAKGAVISGKVTSLGKPVDKATVTVKGKEYIHTLSDSQGNYKLSGVPACELTIQAFKVGLIAKDSLMNPEVQKEYTVNFDLFDPGFNATKLMGFDLVLTSVKPGSVPDELVLSGKLINLPDNSVFHKQAPVAELAFTDQVVVTGPQGIFPKSGTIRTDVSDLPLRMFDYLKAVLHDDAGLTVRQDPGDPQKGEVEGIVKIDFPGSFPGLSGLIIPATAVTLGTSPNMVLGTITSGQTAPPIQYPFSGNPDGWDLYGLKFAPSFSESGIYADGIHFKGSVSFTGIPLMATSSLKLENLLLSKTGQVKEVNVSVTPKPSLGLGQWTLKIGGAGLDPYGLKVSGDLDIPISSSPVAKVGFADLGINSGGLSGGSFVLASSGINIFDAVKFSGEPGTPLAIQKVPGSDKYMITGAGNLILPKYINDKLKMEYFQISTSGDMGAKAKPGLSVNFFDLGKFKLNEVSFSTSPASVGLNGGFKLDMPEYGGEVAGNIKYMKNDVKVDQLKIAFNIQSKISVETNVDFRNDGFYGAGKFFLSSCPYPVDIDFYYYKTAQGKQIGSHFKVGVSITMGYVKLTEISGGFDFDLGQKRYKVITGGKLTFAADPDAIVALYPMTIEITSTPGGPIFQGICDLTIMNTWKIAKSTIFIDYSEKHYYFTGKTGTGFNLIKGIGVSSDQTIHMEASSKTQDTWWFITGLSNITALRSTIMDVYLTAGWNVKKSEHMDILGTVPNEALFNGRMYGGFIKFPVDFVNTSWGPYGFKGLADVSAWMKVGGDIACYANFKKNAFHISSNQTGGGSLDACFLYDLGCTGIGATAAARLAGDYINGDWSVTGHAHVCGHIAIGCGCGCNDWCTKLKVIPCGAKICVGIGGGIGYSSVDGFTYNLGFEDCTD